jgi:hypothetical protein
VFQGNVEIVKALLEAGAEVTNSGNAALVGGSEPILVTACFSYNADPQTRNVGTARQPGAKVRGANPLELARERGYEDGGCLSTLSSKSRRERKP